MFNLFDGNLQAEQRGNDVVRSVVIYEAGQSFDAVTGCTEPESAECRSRIISIFAFSSELTGGFQSRASVCALS